MKLSDLVMPFGLFGGTAALVARIRDIHIPKALDFPGIVPLPVYLVDHFQFSKEAIKNAPATPEVAPSSNPVPAFNAYRQALRKAVQSGGSASWTIDCYNLQKSGRPFGGQAITEAKFSAAKAQYAQASGGPGQAVQQRSQANRGREARVLAGLLGCLGYTAETSPRDLGRPSCHPCFGQPTWCSSEWGSS